MKLNGSAVVREFYRQEVRAQAHVTSIAASGATGPAAASDAARCLAHQVPPGPGLPGGASPEPASSMLGVGEPVPGRHAEQPC